MKPNRKGLFTAAALLAGVLTSSATVTVQGWWRYGELPDYYGDASANNRRFGEGFSCAGGGNAGAGVMPFGCGGPLGDTGITSTSCLYWTPLNCGNAGMWCPGNASLDPVYGGVAVYNPPPTNYVIECWMLPNPAPGTGKFFMSGSGDFSQPSRDAGTGPGGVYFWRDGTAMKVGAFVVANASQGVPDNTQIGDLADMDPTTWMHIAVVNQGGTNTFYVNGVAHGAPLATNTIPNGNIFAGSGEGTGGSYHGYLDELRISTFAPGQFSTTNLLTRPPGPSIMAQPQSASVWDGGAAPFTVAAAIDASLTYQWQRGGANISGANSATYVVPQVSSADNGAQFQCVLKSGGVSLTSSAATLTVVPNKTADVNFYRQAVNSEASLLAYFPVDGDLGTTISNTKDPSHNGIMEGTASYDGRTNRAFGQRSVALDGAGDVQIFNNPAFEFAGGNGTIEALTYMNSGLTQPGTIFGLAYEGGLIGYALQASADGSSLLYVNDSPASFSWSVPANLIGRMAHVALVIDHMTNVTAIVDGQSLGTKVQTNGFGAASGASAWIGSLGTSIVKPFRGNIDEVAVYGSALSLNTIQVHYSRFLYGTNVSGPSIVSLPGPRTVLAGTAPLLKVEVAGTLPISYQWTSNGIAIPGANSSTLKAMSLPGAVNYVLYATNAIGWTNSQPIAITFAAPTSGYSTAVASDHPIACWRLDEAAGPTTIDSAGYHDATYSGSPVYGAPSIIATETNKAVDFAAAGRATLPNYPELNPKGPFSVELWARPHGAASGVILGSQNRNSSRGGYVFNTYFYGTYGIDVGAPNASVTRYYSGVAPQDGVPVHLVFAWDGVSPQGALYVNGEKITTPQGGYTGDMNNFVNNTVQPLTIGIRYDNNLPWNGIVDEVAFYDYALSDAQVTNHFSYNWVASSITQQPVGVTNSEWSTISMSVVAAGYPNTYQWYKVGTGALVAANNPDGTAHYPNGVTGTTLTIAETHPSDSGQYYVKVGNGVQPSQSQNTTVLITADTNPPVVKSVLPLGTPNSAGSSPYLVKVLYNKQIDPTTGGDKTKYTFTPAVTVNSVTLLGSVTTDLAAGVLGGDWRVALIATAGLTPGQKYSLTVTGVKDQSQTPLTIVAAPTSFYAPIMTSGALVWDYYYLGSPVSAVGSLTGNPNYPSAPQTNVYLSTFDSTTFTTGDLNNVAPFGALGDYYGCSLSGWIKPTVSGDYTFFLSSDDQSQLDLNPLGPDPAGAYMIAQQPGCCNAFTEPPVDYTSAPFTLTAGTSYFIRAIQVEGGGGDYVKVAWRLSTDSTPAASLTPISAAYLSAYKPVPPPAFGTTTYSNGTLTISWSGYQTVAQESSDLVNWTPVPGNPNPLVVSVAGAPKKFYRLVQ